MTKEKKEKPAAKKKADIVVATVVAPLGFQIGAETRVLLPDDAQRRFLNALETKAGKPVVKDGFNVLTRPITLKKGMSVKIDRATLTKAQQQSLVFDDEDDAAEVDMKAADAEKEKAKREQAGKEAFAAASDEERAGRTEAEFVAAFVAGE